MGDQVSTKTRSAFERGLDPEIQERLLKRGRAMAEAIGEAAEAASRRAGDAWREAEPIRSEAAQAGRLWLRQGRKRWSAEMQPSLRKLWSGRAAALGAAGASVPIARELIDDAAVRLGIRRRRESRHWGAFFLGLLLGAAAGVIGAMLTAPKAGREMRDELAGTARDAAIRAREMAGKAREAALSAGEWVPIFQRSSGPGGVDGEPIVEAPAEAPPAPGRKRSPASAPLSEGDQPG